MTMSLLMQTKMHAALTGPANYVRTGPDPNPQPQRLSLSLSLILMRRAEGRRHMGVRRPHPASASTSACTSIGPSETVRAVAVPILVEPKALVDYTIQVIQCNMWSVSISAHHCSLSVMLASGMWQVSGQRSASTSLVDFSPHSAAIPWWDSTQAGGSRAHPYVTLTLSIICVPHGTLSRNGIYYGTVLWWSVWWCGVLLSSPSEGPATYLNSAHPEPHMRLFPCPSLNCRFPSRDHPQVVVLRSNNSRRRVHDVSFCGDL